MDAIEAYFNEVERELDRKMKIVRSDRDYQYYGKYNELGQCHGSFANSLKDTTYVHTILC